MDPAFDDKKEPQVERGELVEIYGLKSEPDLNGRVAVYLHPSSREKQSPPRYVLRLEKEGRWIGLTKQNFRRIIDTYYDSDGEKYYFNRLTGQSTWDMPASLDHHPVTQAASKSSNNLLETEEEQEGHPRSRSSNNGDQEEIAVVKEEEEEITESDWILIEDDEGEVKEYYLNSRSGRVEKSLPSGVKDGTETCTNFKPHYTPWDLHRAKAVKESLDSTHAFAGLIAGFEGFIINDFVRKNDAQEKDYSPVFEWGIFVMMISFICNVAAAVIAFLYGIFLREGLYRPWFYSGIGNTVKILSAIGVTSFSASVMIIFYTIALPSWMTWSAYGMCLGLFTTFFVLFGSTVVEHRRERKERLLEMRKEIN